jgi:hypothetical protein
VAGIWVADLFHLQRETQQGAAGASIGRVDVVEERIKGWKNLSSQASCPPKDKTRCSGELKKWDRCSMVFRWAVFFEGCLLAR